MFMLMESALIKTATPVKALEGLADVFADSVVSPGIAGNREALKGLDAVTPLDAGLEGLRRTIPFPPIDARPADMYTPIV